MCVSSMESLPQRVNGVVCDIVSSLGMSQVTEWPCAQHVLCDVTSFPATVKTTNLELCF